MIRFLRQNAEIITTICVVLSLLIGGTFLYLSSKAQAAGQAELDAVRASEPVKTPAPAKPAATSASAPVAAEPTTP